MQKKDGLLDQFRKCELSSGKVLHSKRVFRFGRQPEDAKRAWNILAESDTPNQILIVAHGNVVAVGFSG